ncbi:Thioredoxin, mitochondrial [Holothuria leucospilota]|uniref:Thioredoxin, mitochondrial n=1 Tax=Holothuria leucospilota TaxID=206669 RepID=A0A9Q1HA53_HOLLE|nr:Thioredoxin, mitochondrial [Holothuria leucospilota]
MLKLGTTQSYFARREERQENLPKIGISFIISHCTTMSARLFNPRSFLAVRRIAAHQLRNTPVAAQFHSSSPKREEFTIQDTKDFMERVIKEKEKLTIVDFQAGWCGPCKQLAPRLTKAVEKVGDKVNLAKVDVDDNADLAMEYNVSSIPMVLFFKEGNNVDKFVGLIEQDRIEHYIEKYV